MASDVMIESVELSKRYGAFRALDKVSFQVHRGEVVGFLGPNGAGKSTTMRILNCFISATGGTARVHGFDVFDAPLEVRKRVGYLPQRAPLYGEMTVWDYLSFTAEMRGLDQSAFKRQMRSIVEVCGLARVLGKDIRQLSHGYRQRVGLGQALVHNPPILILDEPTSDLDPNEKAEVFRYIGEIGKDRTILLSTHNLAEVEGACARTIILSKGRVVADGAIEDIRARSGRVRYVVRIDEQKGASGRLPPAAQEVQAALRSLTGAGHVVELPTDSRAHAFKLSSAVGIDLRHEIFQLCVARGWSLVGLSRETPTLEEVFRQLTMGEEKLDRGRTVDPAELDDDLGDDDGPSAAVAAAADGDDQAEGDDEDDGNEYDDEDDEDDEDEEPAPKPASPSTTKASPTLTKRKD